MRRRLDLGASLVGRPQVLFLDEPTRSLDPRSRFLALGRHPRAGQRRHGLLLTTQYLEEADRLADHIAMIDVGRVIAGHRRRAQVPGRRRPAGPAGHRPGPGGRQPPPSPTSARARQVVAEAGGVSLPVREESAALLAEVVQRLDAAGLEISDLALRQPTLDDVFLA